MRSLTWISGTVCSGGLDDHSLLLINDIVFLKKNLIPIIYPDIYGKQKVFKENEEKLHIFPYYYNFVLKYYTKEWVQVYFWNKS